MSRNLFLKEMQKNALSLGLWMAIISLLIILTMSVFRTFMDNQAQVMGMLSLIPKGALQFKGISNFNTLWSVLGFYAVNNVIYMMLLGSIFAVVLSSNILLREEYNKTAEYLLTRPLTRSEIFFSKLAALFMNVFLLNLFTAFVGLICIEVVKNGPFSFGSFMVLSVYTLLLNLLFGAVGLFMSTLVKRPRPITTFAIGIVLTLYFIQTLSKITESISKLGYLSPFRYVNMDVVSTTYRLEFPNLVYFIGISVVLTGVSLFMYRRRDIYT